MSSIKKSPFKLAVVAGEERLERMNDWYRDNQSGWTWRELEKFWGAKEVFLVNEKANGSTRICLTCFESIDYVDEALTNLYSHTGEYKKVKSGKGYLVMTLNKDRLFYFTEKYGLKIGVLV